MAIPDSVLINQSPASMERIPSQEDLSKLPHWAQVAFAARCARRVLPIYDAVAKAGDYWREAVPAAVQIAEQSAANGAVADPDDDPAAAAAAAAAVAGTYPANYAAMAASDAVAAAYADDGAHFAQAAAVASFNAMDAAADPTAFAEGFRDDAAYQCAQTAAEQLKVATADDFKMLADNASQWTDASTFSPDLFEPLGDPDLYAEEFALRRYHRK